MRRKAQAAMEFLTTYGWGIMVVFVMIGTLWYFGAITPSDTTPSSCLLGAGVSCVDTKATPSTVQFKIINNLGQDLEFFEINFTGDVKSAQCDDLTIGGEYFGGQSCNGGGAQAKCDDCASGADCYAQYFSTTTPIRNNKDVGSFTFSDGDGDCLMSGRSTTDFEITYRFVGDSVTHQVTGRANLKVEN